MFTIYYLSPPTRLLAAQGQKSLFDLVADVFQEPMPGR